MMQGPPILVASERTNQFKNDFKMLEKIILYYLIDFYLGHLAINIILLLFYKHLLRISGDRKLQFFILVKEISFNKITFINYVSLCKLNHRFCMWIC